MNRRLSLIFLLIFTLFLSGCDMQRNVEMSDNIEAPENLKPPLSGKWTIESYNMLDSSKISEEAASTYLGRDVIFDKDLVVVGSEYTTEPIFKIKNVKAGDYLIYNYKVNSKFLEIEDDYIEVVSVTGKEQFFYEFIKHSKDRIIVNIDGVFFTLRKVTDEISPDLIEEYYTDEKKESLNGKLETNYVEESKTGLLLGLKSLDERSSLENWNYRTIFLRFKDNELVSSYQKKDLFLPRKNGFWTVGVDRSELEDQVIDNIYTEPMQKKVTGSRGEDISNYDLSLKNILYLNSNYISIEKIDKESRKFEFYPLDSVNKGKPIKLSDIIGEKAETAFVEGIYKDNFLKNIKASDIEINEYNFGIFRRNGHWTLKGRVDLNRQDEHKYKDFYINALLPKEIISYDDLSIPWSEIKTNVSEAVDVFVSPNNSVLVVQTYNELLVYNYRNGNIDIEPMARLKLKPNETIVMKEWAIGKYPSSWEEEFLKTEFDLIEVN